MGAHFTIIMLSNKHSQDFASLNPKESPGAAWIVTFSFFPGQFEPWTLP
jgi:hypothetical protein